MISASILRVMCATFLRWLYADSSWWFFFTFFSVMQMKEIPYNPGVAVCFWVGMPLNLQLHILQLCAACLSLHCIALFKSKHFRKPNDGSFSFRKFICCFLVLIQLSGDSAQLSWPQMEIGDNFACPNVCFSRESPGVGFSPSRWCYQRSLVFFVLVSGVFALPWRDLLHLGPYSGRSQAAALL